MQDCSDCIEIMINDYDFRCDSFLWCVSSIACLAALHRHGECLALVNKRLETDRENADLYILRARLHKLFRNVCILMTIFCVLFESLSFSASWS